MHAGYLGTDESAWQAYDASVLIRKAGQPLFDDVLVDVGTADNFLTAGQLLPEVVGGWTCIQFCIDVCCDLCWLSMHVCVYLHVFMMGEGKGG